MDRLEWEHIWVRYERQWVLRDVSLSLAAGRTLYLVGPAGAGKSTLLRVAGGSPRPEAGRMWMDGQIARHARAHILASDEALSPSLTIERNLARRLREAGVHGKQVERRAKAALRVWNLESLREARLRTLSDSLHQRVRLAIQWACPAAAWLLDNPTALLEPEWRAAWPSLLNAWRERETGAVVVATNDPEEGMAADAVAILSAGRLAAAGPPDQLCRRSGAEEIVLRTLDDRAAAATLSSNLRLEAERRPDGLRLRVRHADDTLPGVLQTLGSQVETVWVRRPTMQDAIAYYASLPPAPGFPSQPPLAHRVS